MTKKEILVVEDNADMQDIYKIILEQKYDVTPAYTIKEARKAIEKRTPDLVILDMLLPDEPGDSFFIDMRLDNNFKKIPVIIASILQEKPITGGNLQEINNYVWMVKPFEEDNLLTAIKYKIGE